MGPSKIWFHPCFLLLRWQSPHLEGKPNTRREEWLVYHQGAYVAHRFRYVSSSPTTTLVRSFSSPVNSVAWAPHDLGAILACASSDGKVSVLTFKSMHRSLSRNYPISADGYQQMMAPGTPRSSSPMQQAQTPSPGRPLSFLDR